MANIPESSDLRDNVGKAGAPDSNPPPLKTGKKSGAGQLGVPDSGEHSVKPLPGDNGGVAEGQVTKSN